MCALVFGAAARADTGGFDWSQALAFELTATPQIDRTWQWSLQESTSPGTVTLNTGETRAQSYTVAVAPSGTSDTRWLVGGLISINPNPIVTLASIDGTLYTGPASSYTLTPFQVTTCSGALPLLMLNQTICSYQVPAPQANTGFVGITAHGCINSNCSYDSKSSSPPFDFANATVVQHNQCVTATESVLGSLGSACAASGPATFTATRTLGPYPFCGNYVATSTTTIASGGTTLGTASSSVNVHVTSRFAQWWLANITNASYSDIVVQLQQNIAALQARLTSSDPPAVASALNSIQTYLARYPTWNSVPKLQQLLMLAVKSVIDAYARTC